MSLHYSLQELRSQLATTLTRERIRGWMCLPLWERIKILKLISTIQSRTKLMKFDPDDSWLHKTDINMKVDWKEKYEKEHKLRQEAETETILVKGIGMNSPEMRDAKKKGENMKQDIQILEARVEFLKKNLAGAVKMYKDEKERRQFAEQELKRLKKTLVDPVDEARKAGL